MKMCPASSRLYEKQKPPENPYVDYLCKRSPEQQRNFFPSWQINKISQSDICFHSKKYVKALTEQQWKSARWELLAKTWPSALSPRTISCHKFFLQTDETVLSVLPASLNETAFIQSAFIHIFKLSWQRKMGGEIHQPTFFLSFANFLKKIQPMLRKELPYY